MPAIKSFRTLSGLGDAVYAAPIVAHFAKLAPVHVSTHYPEVFQLIAGVTATTDRAIQPGCVSLRYHPQPGHNYYGDYCKAAGVQMLPFSLPWADAEMHEPGLFEEIYAMRDGRKICLVKEPSTPHMYRARNDFSITPDYRTLQNWMLGHRDEFRFMTVEHETNTIQRRLVGIDYRMAARSVSEYISILSLVSHVAAQICHLVPLAQALSKPLTVFRPEHETRTGFLKYLSPEMVIVPKEFAPASVEVV